MYSRKMNDLKSIIGMTCTTKFDCLNSITGTTIKQTNIAQRIKKRTIIRFLLWLYIPSKCGNWHGYVHETNDHNGIHFSIRTIDKDMNRTET